ncbi:MAG: putative RDD family membrane protein YckC [Sulfurimonas sp.]|jgi:uncharacterized RDD family membrane protein YckC|uniref:RDD family protein n=1 Tax=Sulfurimonas sp. TaxID=2022749 RepID=UPI0039E39F72
MKNIKYAGFWIRFLASFLDTLFLALPVAVFIYFLSDGNWFDFSQYQQNMQYAMSGNAEKALVNIPKTSAMWEIINLLTVVLITILFWRKWKGATPGKKFVGIKIVDAKTFLEVDNQQAFTRIIGMFASIFSLGIGFIMVAFRQDKCGLHDLLASTAVIYEEK